MSLPRAAIDPLPLRITISFSFKVVLRPFRAAALTENRCTLAPCNGKVFRVCVTPLAVVKRLDVYNTLTYACIRTILFLSTIVSESANFVYDPK